MRSAPRRIINHPDASGFREHQTPSFANPLPLDILLFNFQYPKTNYQRPTTKDQQPKTNYQSPTTKDQQPKTKDQRPNSIKINSHPYLIRLFIPYKNHCNCRSYNTHKQSSKSPLFRIVLVIEISLRLRCCFVIA